ERVPPILDAVRAFRRVLLPRAQAAVEGIVAAAETLGLKSLIGKASKRNPGLREQLLNSQCERQDSEQSNPPMWNSKSSPRPEETYRMMAKSWSQSKMVRSFTPLYAQLDRIEKATLNMTRIAK